MPVKYTIIIPVKAINDYVRETVPYIQKFTRGDWELIILPNEQDKDEWNDPRIRMVASGRVGPAKKRDQGASLAAGSILVFLDDDSYPEANLLDVADTYFSDDGVVALGGPGITPPQDSFWQRVSGAVFLSRWSGGAPERYRPYGQVRAVDDWPSVNFMVRKEAFLAIGGFNSPFWPGEDTKLCRDLLKQSGKKILYVPEMVVWHHRRAGLLAHLKQVGAYGIHRGHFARIYPENSLKPMYFVPSAFFLFCMVTLLAPAHAWLDLLIPLGWLLYALALSMAFRDIRKSEPVAVALCALPYIFLTHVYYGIRFIIGILTPKLQSKLR